MKEKCKWLGTILYAEWIIQVLNYWRTLKLNEFIFDVGIPLAGAVAATWCYHKVGKTKIALDALSEMLPSTVSIILGFTVLFVTLILANDTKTTKKLKAKKAIHVDENTTEYQILNFQLTESIYSEILLLLVIFFYCFYKGLCDCAGAELLFLVTYVYLTLHILLGVIRYATNMSFILHAEGEEDK